MLNTHIQWKKLLQTSHKSQNAGYKQIWEQAQTMECREREPFVEEAGLNAK